VCVAITIDYGDHAEWSESRVGREKAPTTEMKTGGEVGPTAGVGAARREHEVRKKDEKETGEPWHLTVRKFVQLSEGAVQYHVPKFLESCRVPSLQRCTTGVQQIYLASTLLQADL
jgi:hypothetical protein